MDQDTKNKILDLMDLLGYEKDNHGQIVIYTGLMFSKTVDTHPGITVNDLVDLEID